jgi:cytochrome c5
LLKGLFSLALLLSAQLALAAVHPGKATYDAVCAACHNTGALNAPKIQQTVKWKMLGRKRFDGLVGNTLVGIGKMPAKGGKLTLTDMQVAWAVHYLVTVSDARLPEPTGQLVKAARAEGDRMATKRASKN